MRCANTRDYGRHIVHQTGRLKIGLIHAGKYHDSAPPNDEEKKRNISKLYPLQKQSLNIPYVKGQLENFSSRSEYMSNHMSNVPMNSACETSVRDPSGLAAVRSVLLKNVPKEASIKSRIGRCNSSGQLFSRQSTNSGLSMILVTPLRVAIRVCFWSPISCGSPSAQLAYLFGQFLIWEGRPDPMD